MPDDGMPTPDSNGRPPGQPPVPPTPGMDSTNGTDAPVPGTPEVTAADPVARAEDGTPLDERGQPLAARISTVVIEDEMKSSYLDYAMSVIVGRALPDVRDGLKPVHRRILYSMDETGLRPSSPYRKCASAVGDVMKKYHPHGDSSIYDALVRMGQDFSIRYELIDGHGNFGSVDGDPPAAMRYTEARLSRLAMELLRDIDEDTVEFEPNYDGYEEQPTVLPARFPNLLANGASGIAVGMATNIPPHNLRELIDATTALIDDPTLTAVDLMDFIPAPDFPTGGLILGQSGVFDAYTTGRGLVKVRAVATIEEGEGSRNRTRIVVTEIPYMVNKANLLIKMARLVNDRVITGIADLRDESSREGMRVVIDLKRDANPQVVLNQLYKHTQLQDTFGVNLLALVDGVPKTLTLDQALHHYIAHQVEVIERRTAYRLRKAEARAHVLRGLLIALDHIDEIITLIRSSESADAAKLGLIERYALSDIQAQAILDMQLRRLAALERQKIQDEFDELMVLITDLNDILGDPGRVKTIIKEEMGEIRDRFGDERKSRVIAWDGDLTVEDLIPVSDVVVTLTEGGYIKRTPVEAFKIQKRGGKGVRGAATRGDDVISTLLTTSTHDHLLFFTNQGRMYRIKGYQIPEKARDAKGVYVANVPGLAFEPDETVAAVMSLSEFDEDRFVTFATRNGTVKRTPLDDFDSAYSVLIAINLRDGDELISVAVTSGDDDIMLVSRAGKAIRFHESDVRSMGRTATGVRGMRLVNDEDAVLGMAPVTDSTDRYLLTVTRKGKGKRTKIAEYSTQGRGGQGLITHRLDDDEWLAGAKIVPWEDAEILLVSDAGTMIRMDVLDVRPLGRSTSGVRLMDTGEAAVAGLALVLDNDDVDADSDDQVVAATDEADSRRRRCAADGVAADAADSVDSDGVPADSVDADGIDGDADAAGPTDN